MDFLQLDATTLLLAALVMVLVMVLGAGLGAFALKVFAKNRSGSSNANSTSWSEVQEFLGHQLERQRQALEGKLDNQSDSSSRTLARLEEKLGAMNEAHNKLGQLTRDIVGLRETLSNRTARGAMGEIQLERLVRDSLPPNVYKFQVQLDSDLRPDCIVSLDQGSVVPIDSKFPLEDWRTYLASEQASPDVRRRALASYSSTIKRNVDSVARYYLPAKGVELVIMFLPSEGIFSALHAYLPDVVDYAWDRKVLMCGPTTLMALLNSIGALIRDAELRQSADELRRGALAVGQQAEKLMLGQEKVSRAYRQLGKALEDSDGRLARIARGALKLGGNQKMVKKHSLPKDVSKNAPKIEHYDEDRAREDSNPQPLDP